MRSLPTTNRLAFAVLTSLGLGAAAAGEAQIFAAHFTARVTSHPAQATGDAPPMRTAGSNTTLSSPRAVEADFTHRELFVANGLSPSIVVFAFDANGDATPRRTLTGPATQLGTLAGLHVDEVHDELFVKSASAVRVFARSAGGDTAPLRSLAGDLTLIGPNARDVTVDLGRDELLVTNWQPAAPATSAILVFERTDSGNVAPLRFIAGPATGITEIHGIAVDEIHDEIVVACASSIRVFARTVAGDVAPLRVIEGAATGLGAGPQGVALDLERDQIVVSVPDDDAIRVFARTADGDVAPARTVVGAATGFDGVGLIDLVPQLFADGFQTGAASAWSIAVP